MYYYTLEFTKSVILSLFFCRLLRSRLAGLSVCFNHPLGVSCLLVLFGICWTQDLSAQSLGSIEYIAHRGVRGIYPENSVGGFILAMSKGATILEMDLAISKDNRVILSHDPVISPSHCFNSEKGESEDKEEFALFQLSYQEIQQFVCGSNGHKKFPYQEKASETIPLLETVIDTTIAYASRNNLNAPYYHIELKYSGSDGEGYYPEIEEYVSLVLDVLSRKGILGRTVLTSFNEEILQAIDAKAPEVSLGLNVANLKGFDKNIERLGFSPDYYVVYYRLISKKLVRKARMKGITVSAWTVNDVKTIEKLRKKGVTSIISDFPGLVK